MSCRLFRLAKYCFWSLLEDFISTSKRRSHIEILEYIIAHINKNSDDVYNDYENVIFCEGCKYAYSESIEIIEAYYDVRFDNLHDIVDCINKRAAIVDEQLKNCNGSVNGHFLAGRQFAYRRVIEMFEELKNERR